MTNNQDYDYYLALQKRLIEDASETRSDESRRAIVQRLFKVEEILERYKPAG